MAVNTTPRLSIGLPVYNGARFLGESIEALLGQSFEDFELIISDNASTDATPDICQQYAAEDPRIRYIRQPRNIGLSPNHNYVIREARGELLKMASHDDLYARDLLKRCIEALDAHPEAILAHGWEARIDFSGNVIKGLAYSVAADAPQVSERFRSMIFDGWDDYTYGVVRRDVLLRTRLHRSHHLADRTFNTELSLRGPFVLVPDWLYFRREHPGRASDHPGRGIRYTVRTRAAGLDPRRADRLRHPVIRLYAEYILGYVTAIHDAPMPPAERRKCYRHLARWLAWRATPVMGRTFQAGALHDTERTLDTLPDISIDSTVAGRERRVT
ncbi:MAG TPA: glycosyltransferase family 2 protein [Trebonia sp.]|nr:glycosyltransferase family 2 protein [Trebonia sp.]